MSGQGRVWCSSAGVTHVRDGKKVVARDVIHANGTRMRPYPTSIGTHCLRVSLDDHWSISDADGWFIDADRSIFGDSGFFVYINDVWTLFIIGLNGTNFPNDQTMYDIHTGIACPCDIIAIRDNRILHVTELPHDDDALKALYNDCICPIMTTYFMYGVTDMEIYQLDRQLCRQIAHMCGIEFTFGGTPKIRHGMSIEKHLTSALTNIGNSLLTMIIRARTLDVISINPWMKMIGTDQPVKHAICDLIARVSFFEQLIVMIANLKIDLADITHVNPMTSRARMMQQCDQIFQTIVCGLKRVRLQMASAMTDVLSCMNLLFEAYMDRAMHYYLPVRELNATITQMQRVQSNYNLKIGELIVSLNKNVHRMQSICIEQLKRRIIESFVHELHICYPDITSATYVEILDFDYLVDNMVPDGRAYPPTPYTQTKFNSIIADKLSRFRTAIDNASQYQRHHHVDMSEAISAAERIIDQTSSVGSIIWRKLFGVTH